MSDETAVPMVNMGTWRLDHVIQMRNAMMSDAADKLQHGLPTKAGNIMGLCAFIDVIIREAEGE